MSHGSSSFITRLLRRHYLHTFALISRPFCSASTAINSYRKVFIERFFPAVPLYRVDNHWFQSGLDSGVTLGLRKINKRRLKARRPRLAQVLITIATRIINFGWNKWFSLEREGRFKALLCFQAKGDKDFAREGMKLGVTGDYRGVEFFCCKL